MLFITGTHDFLLCKTRSAGTNDLCCVLNGWLDLFIYGLCSNNRKPLGYLMSFSSLRQLTLHVWYYQSWYCRLNHGFCSETQTDYFSEFIPATVLATSRFWRLQKSLLLSILLGQKTKFMFSNFKVIVLGNHRKYLFQPCMSTSHLFYECIQAHRSCFSPQLRWVHTMPRGMVEWRSPCLPHFVSGSQTT